jgi:non-ribosomal peptide synthetase component F
MTQTVDRKAARQAPRRSRARASAAPGSTGAVRQRADRQEAPRSKPTAPPTLVDLFAAQVAARPRAIALSLGSAHLSYADLDARAEQLAERLTAAGARPGAMVGLCLPRSLDLIVALVAILKSGAAYLPLDPAYPGERLAFMVEDADASLIIVSEHADWLPPGRQRIDPHSAKDTQAAASPTRRAAAASDLAYVIYTSGSTGKPKGVAIEHAAVTRLFSATDGWFGFRPSDVWTLFHSVSFDFSVWEIWGALLHGGRLVIVPESTTRDPAAFFAPPR